MDSSAPLPLLLLTILLLTLTTTSTSTSPSSHFQFQEFNVEKTISEATKLINPTLQEEEEQDLQNWKVKLLHRDNIAGAHKDSDHRTRFNARIKRDAKRFTYLLRRLNHKTTKSTEKEEEDEYGFGSDVVSGTEQGSGEYFVRIGIGSPPTYQYLVIDSGSDIVWVQCQPCSQCYNQSDPIFNPSLSTSFTGISCSSSVCHQLLDAATTCHQGNCAYELYYGDGSSTRGTLALETLTLGRTVVRKTAIGCGNWNQGMFIGAGGLLGLGGGPMSFVNQLGDQTGGAFGYCLLSRGVTGSSGNLQFGRQAMPLGAAWVPLIHNPLFPSFYYVSLSGLGVGGLRVPILEDVFRVTDSGDGGVVMDTGTAVTRFPAAAYNAFRDAFVAQTTNLPRAKGVSIFDTCYDLNGFVSVRVPTVSFYFSGGQVLTLPGRNFLIPVDGVGTFCFAFAPSSSRLSIFGNIQQEGIQISIDGANGFVGFGPNVC